MILKCVKGPMDGAVYCLSRETSDPKNRSTNRKPDGLWFDGRDEEGRNIQHHYKAGVVMPLVECNEPLVMEYVYSGQVEDVTTPGCCEHGVVEGDWCESCNRDYKAAAVDPANMEHICVGGTAIDEAAGMAWWNAMSHAERSASLDAVGRNASPAEAYQWHLIHSGTAQPLTCANCGEVSTNPGQFIGDGRWICTEACRTELCSKQSLDDLAASGGIVDAP